MALTQHVFVIFQNNYGQRVSPLSCPTRQWQHHHGHHNCHRHHYRCVFAVDYVLIKQYTYESFGLRRGRAQVEFEDKL